MIKIIERITKIYDIKYVYYENITNEESNDYLLGIINVIILLYKFGQTWDALTLTIVGMTYNLEQREYNCCYLLISLVIKSIKRNNGGQLFLLHLV